MAEATTTRARAGLVTTGVPLLRATFWGLAGVAAGSGVTVVVQGAHYLTQQAIVTGFAAGLAGWLLGIGGWEAGIRPFFGGENTWDEGNGAARFFRFNSDHKIVGIQYLVTAALTFAAAGVAALLMRWELATPQLHLFATKADYNMAFSIHGTLMLFAVSVVGIVGGFGNYFVPLMVGADDMVFPRVNGISYWFVPPGVLAITFSPLAGGFQTGWTGYEPLAATDAPGQLLYFLGVIALGLSSVLTALNTVATILYKRTRGLSWRRLPVFCWSMLVTAVLNLLWVPVVTVAMIMAVLDRVAGTQFFTAKGMPVLWEDMFWIFGHPEVYIIVLGAWGLWLEILAVMGRKTLFGYRWAVGGMITVGLLSGIVWVHHMFTTVNPDRWIPFMTTTEIISVPTGFMYLAAAGTLWKARVRLTTPMLLVLMSLLTFAVGGLTGVFLADVPADLQLHNTYFVVAHFHYTIIGGMVMTWFAGAYYWFPKMTGKMYSERAGKFWAWLMFAGFNATFLQMFLAGLDGMNRRVAVYPAYLENLNLSVTASALVLGPAFLGLALTLVKAVIHGRPAASHNPWGGKTLEWMTPSPPPHGNFPVKPVVTSDFYGYGDTGPEPGMLPFPGARRDEKKREEAVR